MAGHADENFNIGLPLLLSVLLVLLIAATQAFGQEAPEKLPTKEDLAKDNKLFIELASKYLHWDEPTDPIHMVGPLYLWAPEVLAHGCLSPRRETFS